jgi:hypothetical protein
MDEGCAGQVSGNGITGEAADQDLFAGGGHGNREPQMRPTAGPAVIFACRVAGGQ